MKDGKERQKCPTKKGQYCQSIWVNDLLFASRSQTVRAGECEREMDLRLVHEAERDTHSNTDLIIVHLLPRPLFLPRA